MDIVSFAYNVITIEITINMKYTKEEIELRLKSMLSDCLEHGNQESAIISLEYDPDTEEATIRMSTHIVEEDDYVGFEGY